MIYLHQIIAQAAEEMAMQKEDWLRQQCDEAGLEPEQMAKLFMLEESPPELDPETGKIQQTMRLVPRRETPNEETEEADSPSAKTK